ncbi:MAG: hypothetical protein MUF87_02480 [Anaerolineae bacterium]|jgi:hypothetical protein|nr:hypothetical protein [Anaerolineae bacterium]
MSLEGLNNLLEKNEVVSTASALDLRERPEAIEAGYLRHVRTFIPMSRYAEGGTFSIEDFQKRLIKRTREGKAPRGYIAAGYGYGKTSTALYIWQQAEAANLLTVPPFQLEKLSYLIEALYGWARYCLSKKRPALIEDLDAAYEKVVNRSLDGMAKRYNVSLEDAQKMLDNGVLNLEAQPNEYVGFFSAVTEIALRAGYSGVILIADEIQQFIRPRNEGRVDTISPLFNVIQLLGTHEPDASLNFGFLLSITLEEIAMIRDSHKRGDLLARLKELSIDLTDLYDMSFARNLWERLAKEFDFATEAEEVIDDWTLIALGNISANKMISDGPRTVVNVLKRAVAVYLERLQNGDARPYTPINMIDDFLDERIYFKGNDKLPSITRQRLLHPFVSRDLPRYGPAIKLIAAFSVEGAPWNAQVYYQQVDALQELMNKGIGEIVRVGTNFADRSIALVGLDVEADPNWMKETIRNFRLGWNPHSRETMDRTFEAFKTVLTERVFPKAKIIEIRPANMVANYAIILEVDIVADQGRRYPKRRLHIRFYWEDEPLKDAGILGDVCLEYRLSTYRTIPAGERRQYAEPAHRSDEAHTITIPLNLDYAPPDAVERALYSELKDVWSPYDLSPIILLNLYQLMVELKASGDMPSKDVSMIESAYLPEFVDYATVDLFNEQVGANVESAGAEINTLALTYLFKERYPDYVTLMGTQNWASSLAKYLNALRQLDSPLHRRGDEVVSGSKDEIADKFTLSNTGFDSFATTFNSLIKIERDFSNRQPGHVRFTLHPLERLVVEWLRDSDHTVQSGKHTVKRISRSQVLRWAIEGGYQTEEIEKTLEILEARELITCNTDWITETVSEFLDLEALKTDLHAHREDVRALVAAFPDEIIRNYYQKVSQITQALDAQLQAKTPDLSQLNKIANSLKNNRKDVNAFAKDKRQELGSRLGRVSITALRENELILLHEPMVDEVDYVDQVNALRVWLSGEIDKTKRKVDDHESEIKRVRELLRPDIAINELPQISAKLKELEIVQSTLQGSVLEARDKFKHYENWRALVKEGAKVIQELDELRLEGVKIIREQMKHLSTDLRAEISSRKLGALTDHQRFTIQLEDIRRSLEDLQRNARAGFESERDQFVRQLREMEAKIDPKLSTLAFNPSDPKNVYTLLYDIAANQFRAVFQELRNYIDARKQTTQVLHRQASQLSSRESSALQNQAEQIEVLLNQAQTHAANLYAQLETLLTSNQLLKHISALTNDYKSIRRDVMELQRQLETLRSSVSQLEPNVQEKRLRDCLTPLISTSETRVDIFTLQRAYADDATFWAALRGLLEKDCITLAAGFPTANFATSAS